MDAAAEIGRNPASKHQIQHEYGKRVGWRGTELPNPFRETNFSVANGDREIFIFSCSAGHDQDWQPYPVDPYSAICDVTTHTYIHTWHRMTRMTGPDCVVMCNLINTYIHTCIYYIHTYIHTYNPPLGGSTQVA